MPSRDAAPIGAPCWIDLNTSDVERSSAFYRSLFTWTTTEPADEFGGYFNFLKDGSPVGGCMARVDPEPGVPDAWSVYLATDDLAKTLELATSHGAQVYVQPMAVGDLGTMGYLGDSAGAAVGVWQPGVFNGFSLVEETGAPCWFELHTRDYAGSVAFYRDTFGWDTHVVSDTPDFRYTVMIDGEHWLAGIMDASDLLANGAPSHWSVYFGVDDTDAALATTVALGGAVVMPAEDTPYGRIAVAADPTGAIFNLVAPLVSEAAAEAQ
jgi:predicted enzyme related to lactoylglutathione lyase